MFYFIVSAIILLILFLAWFYYAYVVETKSYEVHNLKLPIDCAGFDILHISDLHLCSPESHKLDFLQKVSADANIDLVFLTGDVFENYSGLPYINKILSRKPNIGAYAVLGNHDYYDYKWINKTLGKIFKHLKHPKRYRDITPMLEALQGAGFKVLRNEVELLPKHKLAIIGIDYPTISSEKFGELVTCIPDNYLKIVLFHIPLNLSNIVKHGIDVAFGGHTHGGQIKLPFIGAIFTDSELTRKNASGLFQIQNTYFHISNGAGCDPKTNIRFLCKPSATILQVRDETKVKS